MDIDIIWDQYKRSGGIKKEEYFRLLFEAFHKPLCFFSNRIIKNEIAAEDIVQEIFLKLWEMKSEEYGQIRTIKAFLFVTTQHRCLNYLRNVGIQERNYKELYNDDLDEDYFLCQQIHTEVISELFDAIKKLPDKCREIFILSYFNNESEKAIADKLGISVNTVKTQKQRAKMYLRVRLKDLFVFLPFLFSEKFFS